MAGILLNRSRQVPAEDTPAFGGIAERFRRAGDLDRAIALCREGLKKFPDQLSARVTLGWSLLDKGQYDEARAELERVLRRAPDNLAAIRGLAELHDRSEGALTSIDEREAELDAAAVAAAMAESVPPAAPAPAPPAAPPQDLFAPISVKLGSATAEPSPEILHTAEDAGRAAREAALAAAAAALLGIESVETEAPAAAAMAASRALPEPPANASAAGDLDVDPFAVAAASFALDAEFDAGAADFDVTPPPSTNAAPFSIDEASQLDAAVDLFVGGGTTDPAPAEWTLSEASSVESFSVAAFEPAPETPSEADQLVAALRSLTAEPAGGEPSLVLEMAAPDESSASLDEAFTTLEASLVTDDAAMAVEPVALNTDPSPVATWSAEGSEEAAVSFASQAEVRAEEVSDLTDPTLAEPAFALLSDAAATCESVGDEASLAAAVAVDLTPAADDVAAATHAAPLADVREIEPEPAFVPDLSFALDSDGPADGADLLAGLPEHVMLAGEAPHAPAFADAIEPEFVPDLSSIALEDAPFELQAPTLDAAPLPDEDAVFDMSAIEGAQVEPDLENLAFLFEDRGPEPAIDVLAPEAPDAFGVAEAGPSDDPIAATATALVADEIAAVLAPTSEPQGQPEDEPRAGPEPIAGPGAEAEEASPFAALVALSPPTDLAMAPAAPRSTVMVAALERFLRKVEARRLQLSSESVA